MGYLDWESMIRGALLPLPQYFLVFCICWEGLREFSTFLSSSSVRGLKRQFNSVVLPFATPRLWSAWVKRARQSRLPSCGLKESLGKDGFFHQSLRWYIPASLQIYFRSAFPSVFFFFFFFHSLYPCVCFC